MCSFIKNKFQKILLISLLVYAYQSQAQCTVQISPDPITIDCGESVDLSALGLSPTPALSTSFNSGSLGAGWSSSATVLYNNPCGPSLDGTSSAWFGDVPLPRTLTTNGFDMSCGGQVCFDLDFAGDDPCSCSHCEDPDQIDEGVYFQYSTDGGATWIDIFYFDPQAFTIPNGYYSWDNYCFTIPAGAWTANTMFQWTQPNATSTVNDHWGIDNVTIIPSDCSYWYDWDNIAGSPDPENQTVSPLTTTTYNVTYTDGVDACTDDVTVNVNPYVVDATATATSINCGDCVDLDVTLQNPPTNVCQESASNTGYDSDNFQTTINGFPCVPSGATITQVLMDATIGTWCTSWYDYDLYIDGVLIQTGMCNVTNFDLSAYLPFNSVTLQSGDNDAWSDYITIDLILNITYTTNPVYDYSWTPSTDLNDPNIQTPQACPTADVTYTGTITEVNSGCTASDDVSITVTCPCTITNMTANIGACDPTTSSYTTTGTVEFVTPPTTGQLIIEDCNGNQDVYNAPFTSPTNYT
ncbi:MAG: hypothetical protein WDZ35_00005, partial [Crocinitomicaceae bacterium]